MLNYKSIILFTGLFTISLSANDALNDTAVAITPNKEKVTSALANIAVPFEENRGQADAKVAFQAKTLAGPLFVTKDGELVWSLTNHLHPPHATPPSPVMERGPGGEVEVKNYPPHSPLDRREVKANPSHSIPPSPVMERGPGGEVKSYSIVERFVGGAAPKPTGKTAATTQVNYFHGNDKSKWHSGIPTWQQVSLGEVWPGIEVSVAARGNNAEKLFTVAPGADVSKIAVEVAGGELAVTKEGALKIVKIVPTLQRGNASGDAPASRSEAGGRITEDMTQTDATLERRKLHSHAGAWERSKPPSQPSPLNGEEVLKFTAPVAWQEINGERKPVQVAYQLFPPSSRGRDRVGVEAVAESQPPSQPSPYQGEGATPSPLVGEGRGEGVYGFTLGPHDPTQPVIIDPLLQASYLGGSNQDTPTAITVSSDAVYVAGYTGSSNFPGTSGGSQVSAGDFDAFVAKLNLNLTTLMQATYLGGSIFDSAITLAITSNTVYVSGCTYSSNFPGTSGGAQISFGGGPYDAWVAKLSLDLKSLTQASYLGGSSYDIAYALNVSNSAVYVVGDTQSSNFPGTSGGAQASFGGFSDAFVAKLNLDLKSLIQASYLGGSGEDYALALNLSSSAVYVAGSTQSNNFPGTSGGAQANFGGGICGDYPCDDVFVAKLSLDLKSLTQASYLGGSSSDVASALGLSSSAVYVAGFTYSSNFPGTSGGAQASFGGSGDAFVAKLSLDLTTLTQTSYLGGSSEDGAAALNLSSSAVYVAGDTASSNFPGSSGGAQASGGGSYDGFVAKLALGLTSLTQSTYLGGSSGDYANALAVSSDAVYVAGYTNSSNFPGSSGGAQASYGGGSYDGFVAKLALGLTSLTQSTYLGGSYIDQAKALAVSSDAVYVAGYTYSSNFPGSSGGAQTGLGYYYDGYHAKIYGDDVFVAKLALGLTSLTQSTYLGGGYDDYANALAVSSDAVYVAGYTDSTYTYSTFPGSSGGAQASYGGYYDAFVAKLALGLTSLTQSTYLGGSSYDHANALAVSSDGVYVAGYSTGYYSGFPGTSGGAQATSGGGVYDGVVARLAADLKAVSLPTVVTNAPRNITATSVTLIGSVLPNGADATASFNFGTDLSYGTSLAATPAVVNAAALATEVTAEKTGLTCNTLYHYRVKALSSVGSVSGNDQTFTTGSCLPAASTDAPSVITATSVTLQGTINPNGANTTASFELGLTTSYGENITATPATIAATAAATAVTATKTGLTCNKLYHYRAKAVNSAGTSYGTDKSFTTATCPIIAPTAVTNAATGITNNTAILNGSVTPNGAATTVSFELGLTTAYGENITATPATIAATAAATTVTATKTGLICNKLYHYRVKAVNSAGTSYGTDQSFTTATCPIIAPTAVTNAATGITNNTAILNGSVTPNGAATTVSFELGLTTAYGENITATPATIVATAAATAVTATKTGLTCNKLYHYRAKAVNSAGTRYGADKSFTTGACVPDFVVTSAVLTPSAPLPNGTFSAAVTVTNQGTAAGNAGLLMIWSNQATTVTCGATGDQVAIIGTLAAGAAKTVTIAGLTAPAANSGSLRSFVDAACATVESNEANNQLATPYTLARPDFVVTTMVITPVSPLVKTAFNVAVTVKNQSTLAGNGGQLRLWLNQPTAQTCAATGGDKTLSIGNLAVGASTTLTFSCLTVASVGTKTLQALADATCVTTENNETNNQMLKTYRVTGTRQADLLVTAITLTPTTPAANGTFSAAVTVKNQGNTAISGAFLDVWANRATEATCSSEGDAWIDVGVVGIGASKVLTLTGLNAGAVGSKTLRAFVDSWCEITESNEPNNQLTKTYSVQ